MKTLFVKKYQNRKLYDVEQSKYMSLDDLLKAVRNRNVKVLCHKTQEDLTTKTLFKAIGQKLDEKQMKRIIQDFIKGV